MQLTDAQFERIVPYLPRPSGHTKVGQRQVVDTLLYLAKEGCSWRALPERFGNWHTIYVRLNRWARQGVLERVLAELQREQIARLDTSVLSLDSTFIKLHPDATGARRRGAPVDRPLAGRLDDQAARPRRRRTHPAEPRALTRTGWRRALGTRAPASPGRSQRSAGAGHGPRL